MALEIDVLMDLCGFAVIICDNEAILYFNEDI